MKRYIFGMIAICVAVFSFAFTTAPKKTNVLDTVFYYNGSDYSQANVEDRTNWIMGNSTSTCNQTDERPCEIVVSSAQVNPNHTLKTSVIINAAENGTSGEFFVNGGTNLTAIDNKPQ